MIRAWCVLLGLLACMLAVEAAAKGNGPRTRGAEELAEALRVYDTLQEKHGRLQAELNQPDTASIESKKKALAELERQLDAWQTTIDWLGGQRGCTVSRLYWYTDLAEAQAAAERTGRPILSLRMLGKLTDEYSCANSRFFRTALYSNKKISNYLRDHFVLHWQSVRPVPRVTIDFGDGRKLQRTLTGNSAHYVLTSAGQPLDVLPGLYTPQHFLSWLWNVRTLHERFQSAEEAKRSEILHAHHRSRRDAILQQWDADIQRLGDRQVTLVSSRIDTAIEAERLAGQDVPVSKQAPDARLAGQRAVAKTAGEAPLLRFANLGGQRMEKGMDDALWQAIANLHRKNSKLDEASVAVMRREFPRAELAGRVSITKSIQEDPVLRMVRTFEDSIALDTVRNEYLLHRRIHEQFAEGEATVADFDALNEWVYAELFLTPSSDPWLGLAPRDVYTALESDGRIEPEGEPLTSSGG